MRNGTILCLLLILVVACGEPASEPPPKSPPKPEPEPKHVVAEYEVTLPGRSALEMEQQVALPLVQALSEVEGVVQTTTTCEKGRCRVRLQLLAEIDATDVRDHVRAQLLGRGDWPKDVTLRLRKTGAHHFVLRFERRGGIALRAGTLRRTAEEVLAPYLERTPGVSKVVVRGGKRPQCVVFADADRLWRYGLTPLELAEALGTKSPRPDGAEPPTVDDTLDAVVATRGGEPVRLRDVADTRIETALADPEAGRHVSILVTMAPDGSTKILQTRIAKLSGVVPEYLVLHDAERHMPMIVVWTSHPDPQQLMPLTERAEELILEMSAVKAATVHRAEAKTELLVELNEERATPLGITNEQVAATLQLALEGRTVGSVWASKQRMELVVRLEQRGPPDASKLMNLRIRGQDGVVLPLSAVAALREVRSPGTVYLMGGSRAGHITVQTAEGADTEEVVEAIRQALAGLDGTVHVEARD